jgi:pimeloyl-ACP methyl ester carboxylesterase
MMNLTRNIKINDLEFDCIVAGDEQYELVIFLHGFPETSFMWREIIKKTANLGFYCVAPNMRGYSKNACPNGVENYAIKHLREDITNIANYLNKTNFHLVAHDWGAAIGWNLVYNNQQRIISYTALSIPHNTAFGTAMKADKVQQKMSVYITEFLTPEKPELEFQKDNFKSIKSMWNKSSNEEIENYLSVFKRKASLTAAINYYRANVGSGKNEKIGDITVPTLFIWGKNDEVVGRFAAENNYKYVKGDYTFLALDAGHWLVQSKYTEVEAAISEHLLKYKTN